MFDQKYLCLYLPAAGEWLPDIPIATTTVPWVAAWLYFYEIWCVTGEWCGGGVDHEPRVPIRNRQLLEQ